MARKLRVQYPGAIYHVMNRGDCREPIFNGDQERMLFLDSLGEAFQKTDWQVHAFCPMHNHFHLVKALHIAEEELAALRWRGTDLEGRRKSDPRKVRIAARLRRETTMTLEWIAEGLHLGAPTHVAALLQRYTRKADHCGKTLF